VCMAFGTPVMGIDLWGSSPLREIGISGVYPIGGRHRIPRWCVSPVRKRDAIRPTQPLCKRQDVGYVRNSAKANSMSEDLCSQNHTHGYGSANRTPYKRRRASVEYRSPPQYWLRRATNRSIHLEPLTDLGHISKREHLQISPRWLYAYEPSGVGNPAVRAIAKNIKTIP
jgi:hypothetical protein